ncbi:zinc finger, CCHC-type containing protein [Tanacetum coccineum]
MFVEDESCPVYDTDNEEEESMLVYDTDIEDVIEEEEGFVKKGGIGVEEDNIEDDVVVANDICSSMIQTTLNVDVEEDINTKSHELMLFGKIIIIKSLEFDRYAISGDVGYGVLGISWSTDTPYLLDGYGVLVLDTSYSYGLSDTALIALTEEIVAYIHESDVTQAAKNSVKDMTTKFVKLDKFEGSDFRRWQKKMHFLLTTLKVAYVLSTPRPEFIEDETLEQTRKRCKWDNDDYICRGHILNGMSDALFDVYQNVELAKELWDQLKAKYMAEDTSSKKFLVSNFNNYRMVDSRSVMEQYHELLRILGQYTQHDELSLVQLGSHFRIEETLRMEESGKGKGKDIAGSSSINMVEDDKNKKNNKNSKGNKRKFHEKKNDSNKRSKMTCWKYGKPGHFKKDCRVKKNNGVSTSGSGQGFKDPSPQQGLIFDHVIVPVKYYVSHIYEICYVQDDEIAW